MIGWLRKTPRQKATTCLRFGIDELVDARRQLLRAHDKDAADALIPVIQIAYQVMKGNVLAQAPTPEAHDNAVRRLEGHGP